MQQIHDTTVQDTIIEQLQSPINKINGFNFFAYTGIKDYVACGENELMLKCPRNPKGITHFWIKLNPMDGYDLIFCKNNNNMPVETVYDIYFDMLGEVIARNLGVF